MKSWRFFVDRGGTFTDCIGVAPSGDVRVVKVLSTDDAPLVAMRRILELPSDAPLPACELRLPLLSEDRRDAHFRDRGSASAAGRLVVELEREVEVAARARGVSREQ